MKRNTKHGFTILEMLLVIAISASVVVIFIPTLSSFRGDHALRATTADVVSLLHEARMQTLSSVNRMQYGVYFETGRAVLFPGSVFTEPNSQNKEIVFPSDVRIPPVGGISLSSGTTVVFKRLSGETDSSGTITLERITNSSHTRTITILKTGIVSSQ